MRWLDTGKVPGFMNRDKREFEHHVYGKRRTSEVVMQARLGSNQSESSKDNRSIVLGGHMT